VYFLSAEDRKDEMGVTVARGLRILCLFLVTLLLYNPFLSLIHFPAGLELHHLARNRATIGSSELQHYSPVTDPSAGELSELAVRKALPEPGKQENGAEITNFENNEKHPAFSFSLWFRPPPVV